MSILLRLDGDLALVMIDDRIELGCGTPWYPALALPPVEKRVLSAIQAYSESHR
jgi:hypothetical protein